MRFSVPKLRALLFTAGILCAGLILIGSTAGAEGHAQGTPVPLEFPTATATPGPPTETPTRTPTSAGRPLAEAISDETNIRAGPDINENRIAQIYPGTLYPIIGKRFDWYQIEYPNSPNGTAWVYNGVVTVTGDIDTIPELELEQIPTLDPAFIAAQETAQFVSATPGAIATLTAQVMITPTGVFTAAPAEDQAPTLVPGAPLPTFTYPPATPSPIAVPRSNAATIASESSSGLAPIVPILVLGGLGLLGLLIALLRRL